MSDSTPQAARSPAKPRKPKDFPLFKHATGRWAKKVKGKTRYFGKIANDPDGQKALLLWISQKDRLLAGLEPHPVASGTTVADLANSFMTYKDNLLESGELSQRMRDQYYANCELVCATFGKTTGAADVAPDDFQRLRAIMAKKWGPVRLGNQIQTTRSLFKYGFENGLLDKPARFGQFKKPSAKTLRQVRTANGPKVFTREQLTDLLASANTWFKAMLLLGVQAGFGNTDVALLQEKHLDLAEGWITYPRNKTGMPRRVPLWADTIQALRDTLAGRPAPKNPDSKTLVFIGPRGQNFVGNGKGYRVTAEFDKTAKAAGVEGRTFYDLRRTFQTISEGAHDLVATQSIMGHAPASGDMSAIYRQSVDDSRLRAVVDHVHVGLYPPPITPAKKAAKTKGGE